MLDRLWAARVVGAAEELLAPALGERLRPYAPELAAYLPGALGNAQRIDYGTGHETAFAALLFCLARAGAVRSRVPVSPGVAVQDLPASLTPGSAPSAACWALAALRGENVAVATQYCHGAAVGQ